MLKFFSEKYLWPKIILALFLLPITLGIILTFLSYKVISYSHYNIKNILLRYTIYTIFLFLYLPVFLTFYIAAERIFSKENLSDKKPIKSVANSSTVSTTTQTEQTSPTPPQIQKQNEQYVKVIKVIDGDTIQIEGGKIIRYIGIDTPESVDPRKQVECFGKEATERNKKAVEGKIIKIEKDISETDKYNRLLRYVYVDGIFLNKQLVKEGFAVASSYPPDIKYQDELENAEIEARTHNRGLWQACISPTHTIKSSQTPKSLYNPTPTKTLPTSIPSIHSDSQSYLNQQSYSSEDKDCSDFATHAEAQDFFLSQGGPTNDPHRLDSDGDGIACESLP
ncbi:MAG: hypothetical protein KatS3mg089_0163 [Patescibacteria group bacterium]|nr:MAG: hypothetical protein KatS3mg089_0163 [Patescibacteria group bacterium]